MLLRALKSLKLTPGNRGAPATTLQPSGKGGTSDMQARGLPAQGSLQGFPFLRLPGELRNRICEYSLTTTEVLQFTEHRGKARLLDPANKVKDFNKLKYVCRQLYKETAGLEVKFNTVVIRFDFSSSPKREPARIFGTFLTTCAPSKVSWFADIILKSSHSGHNLNDLLEPASHIFPVATFCRMNPHVKIRYIPGGFEYKTYSIHHFLGAGHFINRTIRQQHVVLTYGTYGFEKFVTDRYTDARGIALRGVPNFKIWPAIEDGVDFATLVNTDELRVWVEDMQAWATEGI
ncbi:hypothetical protein EJ02DRAFT_98722 [Clathrospora elynae]|uniref:F-box domain-containing protein n=1 Tax=Clathrospora elynae TaxID=706981 RepID=A0A6A5SUZ0_9PLEO|nr:hypothetical protein EJ02DRAFT_98722 [Clathrospora elynae]